ncbi:histidine kinase [Mucilaginibacter sp. BJC16-A38]|uniref:sensor histidine kinase n=1 Tax=Mucilaginibacter phenanthrenivorans TaxID=1234842 RepID=UPI002156F7D6|nr:sensor histidine kinase [Mucilaginibacter phenanthrenivorans]MCR8561984.1 histidine kinase [Mucilaginibacter phenanthrenivorans]
MLFHQSKYRGVIDRYLPLLLHGLAWIAYASAVYNGNAAGRSFFEFLTRYGPKFIFQAIIFYSNYLYLIPAALARLRIGRFISFNIVLVGVFAVVLSGVRYLQTASGQFSFLQSIWINCLNITWFLVLAILIRFSTDWFRQKQLEKEKENQQLKTELDFLKAQVNPHFFFNSLNNLYALALKQAPETPETILKISGIMRYMLYETDVAQVPLRQEVDMINTYISLQQLKTKSAGYPPIIVTGDIGNLQIEPLLLLPLIENVFKHGTMPLTILLQVSSVTIQLTTSNQMRKETNAIAGGIGLSNLKRRLSLLYPGAHQLKLQEKDGIFTATLILNLPIKK